MTKEKLTCNDIGKFATDDQRCIKNTDKKRFIKEQSESQ